MVSLDKRELPCKAMENHSSCVRYKIPDSRKLKVQTLKFVPFFLLKFTHRQLCAFFREEEAFERA
jgi:hypothetical protein